MAFSTDNERDALGGFLDQQRDALIRKVHGLSDHDARLTPTASSLSLLGIVKHSALWERRWFQIVLAGRTIVDEWPKRGSDLDDFEVGDGDTVAHWVTRYREEAETSREITAAMALDDRFVRHDLADHNLRWLLGHMIEETARHAGHADIIRETIDGSRGQ